MRGNHHRRALALALGVLAATAPACSGADDDATAAATTTAASANATTTTGSGTGDPSAPSPQRDAPVGRAATFAELTAGEPFLPLAARTGPDLAAAGYVESEWVASGTAASYASSGELPTDGRFELTPSEEALYATRVLVRRPANGDGFNGTVVVEWLNVSSGADAFPDYTYMSEEIVREGYAWVGVSAQRIGIEGGPVAVPIEVNSAAGIGIKTLSPERYGALSHPGDAFAYDIFTQVTIALRAAADGGPLAGLTVDQLLAMGESQAAFALTTYANGVQPLTNAVDGFLVHSRGGATAPLGRPGEGIDITGTVFGPPTLVRDDLDVPMIIVQTESDVLGVLGYLPARQPDTERLRLWEMAGTAHADAFQIGGVESALGCSAPINRGQQAYVLRAALHHLDRWARGGDAPPEADRLDVQGSGADTTFATDADGIATGGVRTPAVDAPVDVLSGLPADGGSLACILMGSATPLPPERLAQRYADRAAYLDAYEAATDAAIDAGFVRPEDRDALLAEAQPDRIGG